ncbi:hypothetical protein Tco_0936070 [Tanacetum coccineum]
MQMNTRLHIEKLEWELTKGIREAEVFRSVIDDTPIASKMVLEDKQQFYTTMHEEERPKHLGAGRILATVWVLLRYRLTSWLMNVVNLIQTGRSKVKAKGNILGLKIIR